VDLRRAFLGIRCIDRDGMLVDVILVHMVEMAVVQIIHMAVMANCGVPATRTMFVSVVRVVFLGACSHCCRSLRTLRPPIDPRLPLIEIAADPAMPKAPHKQLISDM
jgi:Fe-S cluster biogenesis protein NfuA